MDRFCSHCGTKADSDHLFCAVCGAKLADAVANTDAAQSSEAQPAVNTGIGVEQETYKDQGPFVPDNIERVPEAEIKDYVGKNNQGFYQKFVKFSMGGKANWNWPVFILTLIGLPFVWFFYRKMYKVGAVVLAAWLALTIGSGAVMGGILNSISAPIDDMVQETVAIAKDLGMYDSEYVDDSVMSEYEYRTEAIIEEYMEDVLEIAESGEVSGLGFLSQLISYIELAMLIVLPMFADFLYYKKAMKDLHTLNANGFPNALEVKAKGGTSVGLAVLTVIVGIIVPIAVMVAVFAPFVMDVFNTFYNAFN